MASVHWTVEMEEQMTKGDMKEAFMVMRDSEKKYKSIFHCLFQKKN